MKRSVFIPFKVIFFAATTVFSGVVYAQSAEWSIVQFSGQMHAIATVCGDYSQSQLLEMKGKQKHQYVGLGMSASKFETDFQKGYQAEKLQLDKESPEVKTKKCEKLKAMAKM